MRLLFDFGLKNKFTPLIHDLLKVTTVLIVIETLQTVIMGQPLFDKNFRTVLLFNLVGFAVFYLIVDRLIGAGAECCELLFSTTKTEKKDE